MNEKLLNSLGMISDEMIVEAMNATGKTNVKRSNTIKVLSTVAVAASLLLIIGLVAMPHIMRNGEIVTTETSEAAGGAEKYCIKVYYKGVIYKSNGYYINELPEGYICCGNTNVVANHKLINNLDSNFAGRVYINKNTQDEICFMPDGEDGNFYILKIY